MDKKPVVNSLPTQMPLGLERVTLSFVVILTAISLAVLSGCGYSGATTSGIALGGSVHGGRQPVSGSSIQLYAAGTGSQGAAAQALLSDPVKSDTNGNFSIPPAYRCPSASSPVYVVAHGGSAGPSLGANPSLVLMAMLGPCGTLTGSSTISINEVTTVGSIWPLAPFLTDASHLSSASNDASFLAAVASVPAFINTAAGSSPGTPTLTGRFDESAKLNSLADVLADCANSTGGAAGDGSACGRLFSIATPPGGSAPTDTVTAALRIAQNPKNAVAAIYGLVTVDSPFTPTLTEAPADWTLSLSSAVATPSISLATGLYTGAQEVTLSDSTPGSTIYYTTDGTTPATSSPAYAGPISIAVTTTVQAIAVLQGSQSSVASSTLTITSGNPPARLAFVHQPSNTSAGAAISPAVTVAVQDSDGNPVPAAADAVKLTLVGGNGLAGTLTVSPQNGLVTFDDLSVSAAGSGYTLLATSPNLAPAISAPFVITPAVSGTPVKLAFLQQPTNALTQAVIAPAVTVVIEDGNGNPVANATNPVTLALTGAAGLAGTLTATPQKGIATFSNLNVSAAGTYTLSATSPTLTTAASASFVITTPGGVAPLPPVKLAFAQQPSNASTGATIAPAVTVVVEDGNGNTVTTAGNPVTLTLVGGTGLAGTLSVTPQNGIATFSNLSATTPGTYTLVAISPSLVPAISTGFTISAPSGGTPPPSPATKLAFVQQPSNASTGATITPAVAVAVQDGSGNTITTATNPVTLSLSGGMGLAGTLTATPQNGIATFSNLSESSAGTYTLSAASPGLTSAASASFTISAPAGGTAIPAKLAFSQQPSNASTGATIRPAVTVVVEDSNGTPVTGAVNPVTITLTTGSGLAGTLTAAPQNGVATFSNLTESAAGTYTLSAASPGLTSATSANFTVTVPVTSPTGATYYLAPNGSDSNNGLSAGSPWLTPNHPLNCGDVISAAPGNYNNGNFGRGKWGAVNCPAGNNVAWLQCATFDTCKISVTSGTNQAIIVDANYWGVQGWEASSLPSILYGTCFTATPSGSNSIHHIIFANDVANGCSTSGFGAYDRSNSASVDYLAFVGDIAYNAANGSDVCGSGFSVYQPIASDTNPGTHIFMAGNFSWANYDGNPCAGTKPTDGEGFNFDTWDFSQGGGTPYTQQGVIENNIEFLNGGYGIEVENNSKGSTHAAIFIKNNTMYGDRRDMNQQYCVGNGDLHLYNSYNVTTSENLIYTGYPTNCGGNAFYAIAIGDGNSTDSVSNTWFSGVNGNNSFLSADGSLALGSGNVVGTNPGFANPVNPGAPDCSGSANVPACMATVIANFTPTVSAAKSYGYQLPGTANVYDPLFPQWLCNVNLPSGLVTMGCQASGNVKRAETER